MPSLYLCPRCHRNYEPWGGFGTAINPHPRICKPCVIEKYGSAAEYVKRCGDGEKNLEDIL